MSKKIFTLSFLCLLVTLIGSCASKEEKQARSDNAFDVQGDYKASKAKGSETDMAISIINQSNRADVRAVVTRLSGQETKESEFLTSAQLDPNTVGSHFGSKLEFTEGDSTNLVGGTNHSEDFGQSDTFFICTTSFIYDANHELKYCLSGNVKKSDYVLRGELSLYLITTHQVTNREGKAGAQKDYTNVSLSYNSAMGKTFFEQYLGTWSGNVNQGLLGPSNDLATTETLTLQKTGDDTMIVRPLRSTVTVDKIQYTYVPNNAVNISQLNSMSVPLLEVVYQAPNGSRVDFFLQIYSMGKMTGSAVLIQGNQQIQLASFALIRQ